MEVSIVQFNRAIIVVFFAGAVLAGIVLPGKGQAVAADSQRDNPDDISDYYGFGPIEIIKLDWGIKDLNIADFNRDGRNDIAIVNNRKARIELLIQKEAVGPSDTQMAVDPEDVDVNVIDPPTRFEKQSIAVSQKLYSLVCGDLNSDGLADLAFYGDPRGLYVILQKAGPAGADEPESLGWRTRKKIKIDDGLLTSRMLVCADLNNDGADDLALAGRDSIYVILQKDAGTLAEPVKYPTSAQTLSVKAGDLNGDNINDLILITSDIEKPVHVRFGLKTGQLGPQVQFFIERPFALMRNNIDGAAGDEILTIDGLSGRLICYEFASGDQKDADWPILFYPLASGQEDTKRDLASGDFDGDGLVDVAISDAGAAELVLYRQMAGLGLAEPVTFPALADIASLSAADIDGDGKTELGVLSVKEKVIGLSEFEDDRLSFPHPIGLAGEPLAMELADVDSDGTMDCLYVSKEDNDIRTLRTIHNLAAAKGRAAGFETSPALELKKLSSNPDGLKVLDVDQDGLQDVLIFVSYEVPILVRQVQKGKFEIVDPAGAQASLIKDASLRSIAVADVDGKASEELLVAQKNFARSLVFSGGRSWSIVDQYNAKSTENQISAVAAFDIDSEGAGGRPAILLLDGQKGRLQILKAGDDKTYRVEKELDVGRWNTATHLKMLFGRFAHSEVGSLLLFDSQKFALITPPSAANVAQRLEQRFSYETKIKDGIYGNLTVGDINGDGRSDVIMVENRRNHIEILTLDAGAKPIPAMRFKIFEQKSYRDSTSRAKPSVEPRELEVADVTNDGKGDLVTVIHDRIIVYPQD
jgi:hypothetical protein